MNYNISDVIEAFLLQSLGDDDSLNIRRNDLASYFSCSPSQINYVLATRFTPQRGYVIESRRGGGGFVTVVRLHGDAGDLVEEILSTPSSEGFSAGKANELIDRLCRDGLLTERESALVKAAVHDKALVAPLSAKNGLRAGILKSVVGELVRQGALDKKENQSESKEG